MCARIGKENAVECGVQHIPEKGTKSVTRCLSPKIFELPRCDTKDHICREVETQTTTSGTLHFKWLIFHTSTGESTVRWWLASWCLAAWFPYSRLVSPEVIHEFDHGGFPKNGWARFQAAKHPAKICHWFFSDFLPCDSERCKIFLLQKFPLWCASVRTAMVWPGLVIPVRPSTQVGPGVGSRKWKVPKTGLGNVGWLNFAKFEVRNFEKFGPQKFSDRVFFNGFGDWKHKSGWGTFPRSACDEDPTYNFL